jgi:hypothetical protein
VIEFYGNNGKSRVFGGLRAAFLVVKLPNLDLKGTAWSTPAASESRLAGLEQNSLRPATRTMGSGQEKGLNSKEKVGNTGLLGGLEPHL